MESKPFSFSKQLEPKSMTLMSLFKGWTRSMFSGFKSQWTTRCFLRNNRHRSICRANLSSAKVVDENTFE